MHDDVRQAELLYAGVDGGRDGGGVADVALQREDRVARRSRDLLRRALQHGKAPGRSRSKYVHLYLRFHVASSLMCNKYLIRIRTSDTVRCGCAKHAFELRGRSRSSYFTKTNRYSMKTRGKSKDKISTNFKFYF